MTLKQGNMGTQVEWEIRDHIGIIRYNNPPLNINSTEMVALFQEACDVMDKDKDVRVLVLCANGRAFCAGSNLGQIIKQMNDGIYVNVKMKHSVEAGDNFANMRMPTICALDGSAYQGGFERVLQCDLVIAAEHVKLVMTGVDLGTWPGSGGVHRLIRLMGTKKTIEYLLLQKEMTAQQALENGVINAIAKDRTAFDMAMEWAEIIASKAPIGPHAVKAAMVGYYKPQQDYLFLLQQHISQMVYDAGDLKKGCEEFFERQEAKRRQKAAEAEIAGSK
ncbi:enoyl-CoA hydratase/isomerase family protein [Candidatus Formimonas warabiya]|uniref:Enoyl-CoA hydratase/isomerase family protein n=1 Tax=Formimonas warabiya TaxID=1761012 RepID=A0A3G1KNH8_FORW1|nr:enoyl-CoA hydratase/isomerase family protein [Candidatus Formimonas warabiya]ATW24007.1 hypothetical protein DCMF_03655 [Candidatus Formimonas warabiya]